jgi:signal peptidase
MNKTGTVMNKTETAAEESGKQAKKHGVFHYLGIGLSIGLLLLVVGAGAILIVIPRALGAIPLTVLTQSMEPILPPGTLIVDQPVKASQVHLGDVVTYQIASGKPDVITHRVVRISMSSEGNETFTFKGDNNAYADAKPVIPAQIKGRVVYSVPWIGFVSLWMNGPARAVVVPIAAGILFMFAAWMFIRGGLEALRKRRSRGASTSVA